MYDPDSIHQPHDALFRAALGDPGRAADLLRSVLADELVAAIDWRSLQRIDASFVDEELRQGQADLLFTAEVGGRRLLLYLLLEHKSANDRFCVLQLLRYVVRIWQQFRREVPDAASLPPIVPFVLHHGAGKWSSPRDLRQLIDLRGLPPGLIDLQPRFRFVLDDLGACDEPALRQRRLTVHTLLPLLHLQQLRRDVRTASLLRAWSEMYLRLLGEPGGQELVSRLVSYVAAVSNDDLEDLRRAYATIHKPSEEQFMTLAERLIQQGQRAGRQEGRHEGRQEGRQEGRREGRAELLLVLLEQRFGTLSPDDMERVRGASEGEMEEWTRRLLTAPSLADVLAR